jgi:3-oxoadipate enol-lactonase
MNARAIESGLVDSSGGASIYYEAWGDGPPIVLVAGLGDDRMSWDEQVARLADSSLVVTIDNRGIGKSSTPKGPYSIAEMADDAHAVVRRLDLEPVVAIGSSMGGAICQRWTLRHPEDLHRLVLTNTWAEQDRFLDALFCHWIRLGEANAGARILESLLLFSYSPDYLNAHPSQAEQFLSMDPPEATGFVAAAQACRGHQSLAEADAIRQPTLVIAGEHDILTRPWLSRRLASRLSRAEFVSLPTGHMVFWERPGEFGDLVDQFLRRPD